MIAMKFWIFFASIAFCVVAAASPRHYEDIHRGSNAWNTLKGATTAAVTFPWKAFGVSLRCRQAKNQNQQWCETADGCKWTANTQDGSIGKCRSAGALGLSKAFEMRKDKCRTLFKIPGRCTNQPECKWIKKSQSCTASLTSFLLNTRREISYLSKTYNREKYIDLKSKISQDNAAIEPQESEVVDVDAEADSDAVPISNFDGQSVNYSVETTPDEVMQETDENDAEAIDEPVNDAVDDSTLHEEDVQSSQSNAVQTARQSRQRKNARRAVIAAAIGAGVIGSSSFAFPRYQRFSQQTQAAPAVLEPEFQPDTSAPRDFHLQYARVWNGQRKGMQYMQGKAIRQGGNHLRNVRDSWAEQVGPVMDDANYWI